MSSDQCKHFTANVTHCNCSAEGCTRKGTCCECLAYHLSNNQLPACAFPDDVEKTYDRSFRRFAQLYAG